MIKDAEHNVPEQKITNIAQPHSAPDTSLAVTKSLISTRRLRSLTRPSVPTREGTLEAIELVTLTLSPIIHDHSDLAPAVSEAPVQDCGPARSARQFPG